MSATLFFIGRRPCGYTSRQGGGHVTEKPEGLLERLLLRLDAYLRQLEELRLDEYLRFLNDRKRMLRSHFFSGMARGVGMAVGFTILGAILVILLKQLASHNLPVIGDFLAEIVEVVQRRLE